MNSRIGEAKALEENMRSSLDMTKTSDVISGRFGNKSNEAFEQHCIWVEYETPKNLTRNKGPTLCEINCNWIPEVH